MTISHVCLLSAMLLIAPQITHAQVAGTPQRGSADVARSSLHGSIDRAKERLDEMDATLALLEKKLGTLNSENRAAAERAIADMREQRDALKRLIDAKRQASEAEWREAKSTIESRWTAFEAAVQKWMDATHRDIADQNELFVARVEAQLKAWDDIIDQLKTSAKASTADRKRDIESTIATIRAQRDVVKAKLEALKQSGKETRIALANALDQSRAAFDRANQTASEAFKRAIN
jgi:hypothetical protein